MNTDGHERCETSGYTCIHEVPCGLRLAVGEVDPQNTCRKGGARKTTMPVRVLPRASPVELTVCTTAEDKKQEPWLTRTARR
eukprot:7112489-Prymnesium_polylepis.1